MQGPDTRMIDNDSRRRIEGSIFLVLFCLTIPAANWMIGHVGAACLGRDGPCVLAVVASSIGGLAVDSLVFLWLAFGSLQFLEGQVIGKLWMVLIAAPLIAYLRRRDERLGLTPA